MRTTIVKDVPRKNIDARYVVFLLLFASSIALYWKPLNALVSLSLSGESYSDILLIPFISIYLILTERGKAFRNVNSASFPGAIALVLSGALITIFSNPRFYTDGAYHISGTILGLVVLWIGLFVGAFGTRAASSVKFPLAFLFLVVPLPAPVLSPIISMLQRGSVEVSLLLFKALGIPVLRAGFRLTVPGVTIEVAQECSSIRSSMALMITCILAARFYLRTFWRQATFVLISLPLSVIKNGIRIITLTLLGVYVNPGFLDGNLHRHGGFVFFGLALVILWPVLSLLRRSEIPSNAQLKNSVSHPRQAQGSL